MQTQRQTQRQGAGPTVAALPSDAAPMSGGRARRQQTFLDRFVRHRSAVIGAVVLGFVVLVALLTPVLMTHDPTFAAPQARLSPPFTAAAAPDTGEYIFGTDNLGRDVYSRVVRGSQVSLTVGLGVALAVVVAGTAIGCWRATSGEPTRF